MESGSLQYLFGTFELRTEPCELLRDGQAVPIQPQPLRVLAMLVGHAGRLVERSELFAGVWGDQTHVDDDRGPSDPQVQSLSDHPRFRQLMERLGLEG